MKGTAHTHSYGPIFLHVETPKRACLICGFAVPARLVPRAVCCAYHRAGGKEGGCSSVRPEDLKDT